MTRYIQSPEPPYELMEVGADYTLPPINPHQADGSLWGDRHYEGMRATDGADIGSRTKHREYMKAKGLTTIDDYKDTWAKAEKERAEFRSGKRGSVTREDIRRTISQLANR